MVTYTNNKKLNKPANGEFPDTWDVPVNQDWDIIDKALGSAATFTVAGVDITLTIDEAQNQQIVLTGTPGATRNIIIPFKYLSSTEAVGGMWVVDNQTNATQNIISEVSGGTGVPVLSGRKALVYSDGTNIKFADDVRLNAGTGISVSGSTVSLSTPVSVANGGTGLTTLTSGNVILGNGTSAPSFVAPSTAGNVLTSNGSTWVSAAPTGGGGTGGITSITLSTASGLGLSFTPNTLTTPGGTMTLSGTLAIGFGGTGAATITSGIVKSNGTVLTGGNTIDLGTSDVSGTLPISKGGTGVVSLGTGLIKYNGSTLVGGSTVNLSSEVTGTLSASNGGTGTTSIPSGFLKGAGSSITSVASINLGSDVSGTLGTSNGGTGGSTTGNGAFVRADSPTSLTGTWGFSAISASGNISSSGTVSGATVSGTTVTSSGTTSANQFNITSTGGNIIGFRNDPNNYYINYSTASGTGIFGVYMNGAMFSCSTSNFSVPANLNVSGIPYAPQANFTVISDQRIKKNVQPYTKSLTDIETLNPVTFQYNGQYGTTDDGVTRVGLIAQQVQTSDMPEIVETYKYVDPDTKVETDIYIINPSELVFALINTVKELDARVKALEAKVGP